ncbi:MAG: ADP compounds hydrolase NudE [Gammaproteobacteria bacterium]|nr:ADP compounds hydrolase NudE [Gammaproteobacteria bacterium]
MPKITNIETIVQTRLFHVEKIDLEFSNGQIRSFERLKSGVRKSVIIVAMQDQQNLLLIKEYSAGTERYELGLPRGLVEPNENICFGANRELQEETGFAAADLSRICELSVSPNYMTHSTEVILAKNLRPSKLPGDEPEPLEVISYNINEISNLITTGQITDSRSIAAIYIVKNLLL